MPWPLVAGAALSAIGTGASLYGQHQADRASRRVLGRSRAAASQYYAGERGALGEEQGLLTGLARDRQNGIGQYINELGAADSSGPDPAFAGRQTGIMNELRGMTPPGQQMYTGGPQAQAEAGQAARTGADNRSIADAIMAEHEDRRIQEQQQMAGHRMSLGDLLRQSRGKSSLDRMRLAKALRDLAYQHKTGQLQMQLDAAGRKGDMLNMLGGLATKVGGMGMSYGASQTGIGAPDYPAPGTVI